MSKITSRIHKTKAMAGKKFALVIHGGAGTISPEKMTPKIERDLRMGLQRSLDAGRAILKNGGSSLDAVTAAVRVLEDDPLFNAGRGAVFTSAGTHEMDAAIMDGRTLKAGAVGAVAHVRNPIDLARAVMEKSPHVMLAGDGAKDFARELGLEIVDDKYFSTEQRRQALEHVRAARTEGLSDADRHGTVGAVALDESGNLAAATSTGGNTNKRPGRVGDSPIIGAGTYANNKTCCLRDRRRRIFHAHRRRPRSFGIDGVLRHESRRRCSRSARQSGGTRWDRRTHRGGS